MHDPTQAGPVPVSHAAAQHYPPQQHQAADPAPSNPYTGYQGYAKPQQGYANQGYQQGYAQSYSTTGIYQDAAGFQGPNTAGSYGMAQQPYNPNQYAAAGFMPGPSNQQTSGDAQEVFMPNLSPMNLMTAGSSFLSGGGSWGQQYVKNVQQRMTWLSGGAMTYHFSINNSYVLSKLFMLFAPFLKRWTYSRQPEQMQGTHRFQPPKVDVNSPDLYIPTMSMWTYIIIVCATSLVQHKYKPDLMYSTVWSACVSWGLHALLLAIILRTMNMPASIPWVEVFAYTGYAYVPACTIIIAGVLGGKWVYYATWVYCSLCMAVFLVRTLKRAVFQEASNYGKDMTLTNYLLLTLAVFQLPFLFWLSNVTLPDQLWTHLGAHMAAAAEGAAGRAAPLIGKPGS